MKKVRKLKILFFISVFIFLLIIIFLIKKEDIKEDEFNFIKLPEGFKIEIFAEDLGKSLLSYPGPNTGPRFMAVKDDILYVSLSRDGSVVALPDKNRDGKAEIITIIENLNRPHGLEFHNDWLYIAEENKVIRVKIPNMKADMETLEVVVDNLPSGGHWTRTIKIKDDKLFVSIGSSCNVCEEQDIRRAAISECDLEGNCDIFASGLRNAVGFVFHPETKEMWVTENARDNIGENLPPDEINIVRKGKHYGWPYCYSNNVPDPEYNDPSLCTDKEASDFDIQAHSAPLGLTFYFADQFPEEYFGNLFVAYHGSWNRKEKTGYKIVRIKIEDNKAIKVEDFATGWLSGNKVLGRPVDIIVKNGDLFISDDNAGFIYRIYYEK